MNDLERVIPKMVIRAHELIESGDKRNINDKHIHTHALTLINATHLL